MCVCQVLIRPVLPAICLVYCDVVLLIMINGLWAGVSQMVWGWEVEVR